MSAFSYCCGFSCQVQFVPLLSGFPSCAPFCLYSKYIIKKWQNFDMWIVSAFFFSSLFSFFLETFAVLRVSVRSVVQSTFKCKPHFSAKHLLRSVNTFHPPVDPIGDAKTKHLRRVAARRQNGLFRCVCPDLSGRLSKRPTRYSEAVPVLDVAAVKNRPFVSGSGKLAALPWLSHSRRR